MAKDSTCAPLQEQKVGLNAHQILLGIVAVLLLVGLIGLGVWAVWHLATKGSETLAVIISASVALITVTLTKYYERKNAVEAELRAQKVPIYEEFIQFMLNTLLKHSKEGTANEESVVSFFQDFTPRIALWGSDEVLLAYQRFRAFGTKMDHNSQNNPEIIFLFEEIVLAMRRDLGFKNAGFDRGAILSLFITDVEKLDSAISKQ